MKTNIREFVATCREGRISILHLQYRTNLILTIILLFNSLVISYAVNADKVTINSNLEKLTINTLPLLQAMLVLLIRRYKRYFLYIATISMALNVIGFGVIDVGGVIFPCALAAMITYIMYARILKTDTHPF